MVGVRVRVRLWRLEEVVAHGMIRITRESERYTRLHKLKVLY